MRQLPFNVKDGDLISVLDRRDDGGNILGSWDASGHALPDWKPLFDTPEDRAARELMEDEKEQAAQAKAATRGGKLLVAGSGGGNKGTRKGNKGGGNGGKKERRVEVQLDIGGSSYNWDEESEEEEDDE